ncbi:MAG: hypothetical protein L7S56_06185 [Candidatus Poseidonia sp.]|nr:hypothetical protein [Poseidonia sp.]
MRPLTYTVVALLLTSLTLPVSVAAPAETLDQQFIFGGQSTAANITASDLSDLANLPSLVEDYTATWCENCVEVEHALDNIGENISLQQYHFHRAIGESQDPFGSVILDERWESLYGLRVPPTVVFNGTHKKVGSVAEQDSLEDDFTELAQRDLVLGQGNTSFSWTPVTNTSGTIAWGLNIDQARLTNMSLSVSAWIVESSAEFEEGTNGQGTYPHIVRDIVDLGDEFQGSTTLELPQAFDGNDLEVHLVYQVTVIVEENPEVPSTPEEDESSALPAVSLIGAGMMVLLAAGLITRRD